MNRPIAKLAAVFGFLTVLLGALGAHAIKQRVGAYELEIWKTAALYQGLHAVALLGLAAWRTQSRWVLRAAKAWALGVAIFSGSLYLLVFSLANIGLPPAKWLGAITPIGGLLLMGGWLCVGVAAWKADAKSDAKSDAKLDAPARRV